MSQTIENEYLIPSIEHIKDLYDEVVPLLKQLKTKADVIEFGKTHQVTMEINYEPAEEFDESQPIEVIRCEAWGDLNYIYVYTNGNKPQFDVWCDFMDSSFIEDITVEEISECYIEVIKQLLSQNKSDTKNLKEIIKIINSYGIVPGEIIGIPGLSDSAIARMFWEVDNMAPKTYDKKVECYDVNIFKKTPLNEYYLAKTEKFDDIEEAIMCGLTEKEKGNKVSIKEISNILNWR